MKKLIIASAATAALFSSVPAFAGNAIVQGFVAPVCEVSIANEDLYLADDLFSGSSISTDVDFLCNDADGATITMGSSEGGLESDDQEDLEVEYVATLSDGGSLNLVLDTVGAFNNDIEVETTIPGSNSATNATLTVVLSEDAPWAGGYSDTISIEITAN